MKLTTEQRTDLQKKGADMFRLALKEGRQLTDNEKTELRTLEAQLDRDEYETLHADPPADPTEAQRRFSAGIENRSTEKPRILTREMRMADHAKGSYPAEFEKLSLGKVLRGYLNGEWGGAELEQRAMASSPTTAGGIMIPTPLAARVIDKTRATAAVMKAGAITVPMDSATLKMARVTQDPTAAWYNEAAAIATSDMAFDSVTFTARKLAALCVINSELLEDTANIDGILEQALAKALGLELDRVALFGSGTPPEPQGLYTAAGVNTVLSVGTPTNYSKFIQAIFAVLSDEYTPNAVIYSTRTAETIAGFVTGIASDKTPLIAPDEWKTLAKFVSNQVSNTLNTGSPQVPVGSAAFIGQWDQLAIGMRRTLRLEVAKEASYNISGTVYSAFQKDQVLVKATLRADVQILQPSAFCVMSDITN